MGGENEESEASPRLVAGDGVDAVVFAHAMKVYVRTIASSES